MGSILSRISDDIREYERLCEKYNEPVQYDGNTPDCYGKHAMQLQRKQAKMATGIQNES